MKKSLGRKEWPEEIERIDQKVRVAGIVRELPGWRVLVLEIPPTVLKKYLVEHHEPDIRQIAEAKLHGSLMWVDPEWREKK